ncbi:CaiB/BaiF CoA transferase family protein [Paracoccus denitrificans]|jgi:crotonobetainyl-CoA:carnitine CoA-transferase CaiB-like acyl-CoA transferase|uniref:L-carnitine dehydratase/bile acid-inducible protein F n=1 Tax=Paracoccus denitrificans (strain Pd 1222) TaxID=318586 RepID=A1AYG7_PARDP|nr:CoA transferase [Paracoccus denitrificans]ABL68311.1 L-carnitine dehydratase/bile acid-inducible protein F [Paracoccus denitrificans PD1222]MBB4627825.1 crotonobetainyl-CoA:carnitine CoA-transferase CaiB-like acyl-CoA transferase [Paracoccus denitrificans]MCU7428639.1 CoA transferase [Paracoccus denitrificans]QAR26400.1 CoA transferase [Paracoccus denitrificans]UPV95329.1 CoA transferase [Paracoccus denitrificans]
MSFQPLKSIRVLDLTSVVVGPAATWRLGQYGADVVKVENPAGDLMRGLGGQSPTGQHSGAYLHLNRGKRNICLDLKSDGARQVIARLIAQADVVVANMRPKALEKLGIDPARIQARHPDKIYCLLTGFGTDGPYGGFPAYDSVVQAAAGIPGLSLARDGVPRYVPLLICDHVVGEIAAGAILAAVIERQATGRGRMIEIPMFETMAAFVLQEHLAQHSFDPPVGPPGDRRLLSPHNMPVQTADGHVAVTINTDAQVRAFLQVTDRAELADDPRFATVAARADNVAEWFEVRGAPLTQRTTAEWLSLFRAADLAAMPCHTLETLPSDPHLAAVGLIEHEDHPTEGRTAVIRASLRVDGDSVPTRSPAAPRGWDTRDVLADAGFSASEIETLLSEGSAHEHHR